MCAWKNFLLQPKTKHAKIKCMLKLKLQIKSKQNVRNKLSRTCAFISLLPSCRFVIGWSSFRFVHELRVQFVQIKIACII